MRLRAPFPWFGGKSRVAHLVWDAFGDVPNYVEPFAGSLAVLLGRPHPAKIETVNDKDCVGPETRILRSDLSWARAADIKVGDKLIGFDEQNGPARGGLRAPTRYRRMAGATVTAVRVLMKPSYRLTFDDGTSVVASANHLWLGGSHASGGRGWRWVKTENMVCNRKTQRSWVLKVADVVEREDSWEAGWLGGMLDGEGSLCAGPGLRITISQNPGDVLDQAARLLSDRGFVVARNGSRRCVSLQIGGGMSASLAVLMRFRPRRLISNLKPLLGNLSLYGRSHRAVGLVSKEFLGEQEVVAIETDTKTFIAEGLASHNCYLSNFWRAVHAAPDEVARWADWPVNEADLHARHRWLVDQEAFRERMKQDPDYFDAKIAGWWVWGICQWIGSGWCSQPGWEGRGSGHRRARGVQTADEQRRPALGTGNGIWRKRIQLGKGSRGVQRASHQLPDISGSRGAAGRGINASALHRKLPRIGERPWGVTSGGPGRKMPHVHGNAGTTGVRTKTTTIAAWFEVLAERLRRVRVCCGEWDRILGPSPTTHIGVTGVFLDPPYGEAAKRDANLYAHDDLGLAERVHAWAIEHGNDPKLRIALCGYEGEHEALFSAGWRMVAWRSAGGYSVRRNSPGRKNRERERIWFSPHCLSDAASSPLFAHAAAKHRVIA